MSDRGSEPAYPISSPVRDTRGMTIREEFASRAMQGLLANPKVAEIIADTPGEINRVYVAMVGYADGLLEELEKGASDEKV